MLAFVFVLVDSAPRLATGLVRVRVGFFVGVFVAGFVDIAVGVESSAIRWWSAKQVRSSERPNCHYGGFTLKLTPDTLGRLTQR